MIGNVADVNNDEQDKTYHDDPTPSHDHRDCSDDYDDDDDNDDYDRPYLDWSAKLTRTSRHY